MQALLTLLVLPPVGLILLAMLALLLRRRWLALLALLLTLLLSVEGLVNPLARLYAEPRPAREIQARAAAWRGKPDTLVLVLGGGVKAGTHADGGYELKPRTAERLRRGLGWSRQLRLPLAFSGGRSPRAEAGAPSEAAVVERSLRELGLPPAVWLEADSPDTRGNARLSAKLLAQHRVRRVLLVTDDLHMPRALAHFRAAAPEVEFLAAPLQQEHQPEHRLDAWLPTLRGMERGNYLAYEWVARIVGH
jgi:uncharacterized SAM-binding protein YcdF (DUF218 family)